MAYRAVLERWKTENVLYINDYRLHRQGQLTRHCNCRCTGSDERLLPLGQSPSHHH